MYLDTEQQVLLEEIQAGLNRMRDNLRYDFSKMDAICNSIINTCSSVVSKSVYRTQKVSGSGVMEIDSYSNISEVIDKSDEILSQVDDYSEEQSTSVESEFNSSASYIGSILVIPTATGYHIPPANVLLESTMNRQASLASALSIDDSYLDDGIVLPTKMVADDEIVHEEASFSIAASESSFSPDYQIQSTGKFTVDKVLLNSEIYTMYNGVYSHQPELYPVNAFTALVSKNDDNSSTRTVLDVNFSNVKNCSIWNSLYGTIISVSNAVTLWQIAWDISATGSQRCGQEKKLFNEGIAYFCCSQIVESEREGTVSAILQNSINNMATHRQNSEINVETSPYLFVTCNLVNFQSSLTMVCNAYVKLGGSSLTTITVGSLVITVKPATKGARRGIVYKTAGNYGTFLWPCPVIALSVAAEDCSSKKIVMTYMSAEMMFRECCGKLDLKHYRVLLLSRPCVELQNNAPKVELHRLSLVDSILIMADNYAGTFGNCLDGIIIVHLGMALTAMVVDWVGFLPVVFKGGTALPKVLIRCQLLVVSSGNRVIQSKASTPTAFDSGGGVFVVLRLVMKNGVCELIIDILDYARTWRLSTGYKIACSLELHVKESIVVVTASNRNQLAKLVTFFSLGEIHNHTRDIFPCGSTCEFPFIILAEDISKQPFTTRDISLGGASFELFSV